MYTAICAVPEWRARWKMKTFNRQICICALSDTDLSCAENSAEMEKNMGITEQTENEMNEETAKEHTAGTGQKAAEQAVEAANDFMRQTYAFAADVKLKECRYCCVMIPKKARICPNCKSKLRKHILGKAVAAVFVIGVIGAGGYGLSAYLGWLPDSVVPVWLARLKPTAAVAAVTTVETTENVAGAKPVEPVEFLQPETEEVIPETMDQSDRPETTGAPQEITDQSVRPETTDAPQRTTDQSVRPETTDAPQEVTDQSAGLEAAEQPENGEGLTAGKDDAAAGLVQTVKDSENAVSRDEETDETGTAKKDEGDETKTESVLSRDDAAAQDDEAEPKETFPEEMDENEAAFRADCVRRGYKELLRNEDYLGTAVWLEAEVICQVDGGLFDENIYYLCVEEENGDIRRYYIIRDDRAADETLILEGDMLTVYGRLFGNCKLPASLVETRPTVPAIFMLCCDLAEE